MGRILCTSRCLNRQKILLQRVNLECRNLTHENSISPLTGNILSQHCRCLHAKPMGWSYCQVNQMRRELKAFGKLFSGVQRTPLTFSAVRSFSSSNGPKFSSEDKNQEKRDRRRWEKQINQLMMFCVVYGIATICYVGIVNMVNTQIGYRTDRLTRVHWAKFKEEYLLKGLVKGLMIDTTREVVAEVFIPERNAVTTIVISGNPEFIETSLREFEDEYKLPQKERLPVDYYYSKQLLSPWLFRSAAMALVLAVILYLRKAVFPGMTGQKNILSNIMNFDKPLRADKVPGKKITFKDVAGLKEPKIEIMEFVDYITRPLKFKALGAKVPKGALLLGPPGCGKTLLAKALASEAGVPFYSMAGSDFVQMIGGAGASRVRQLFETARENTPCIIYIDEIDTIGKSRSSDRRTGESDQTLNQLLVEMDGMGTKEGVIILGSTNRAEVLDKALLRPGRFDRHILIDLPTVIEREELFELYMRTLKLDQSISSLVPRLAQLTPGMSGADIANICNEAAIHAARGKKKYVTAKDFDYATEKVIAGVAKTTNTQTMSEKKVIAYHESGHALVGWLLKHTDALLKVTIVPRTSAVLGFAQYVPSELKLYSEEHLLDMMCMALGGRAAEAIIFNRITTGAQDDLSRVTNMAMNQIKTFGLSKKIGHLSFPTEKETGLRFGKQPYSRKLAAVMDEEAHQLVAAAYRRTEQLLLDNKELLHKLAKTLLERETLNYADIEQLIGPPPHGRKNTIDVARYMDAK